MDVLLTRKQVGRALLGCRLLLCVLLFQRLKFECLNGRCFAERIQIPTLTPLVAIRSVESAIEAHPAAPRRTHTAEGDTVQAHQLCQR